VVASGGGGGHAHVQPVVQTDSSSIENQIKDDIEIATITLDTFIARFVLKEREEI
jgi:hypothetical protein